MERYRVSRHVNVTPHHDGFVVYHKLFGNLGLLDLDGINLLKDFIQPRYLPSGNETIAPHLSYLNELKDRFFIVPEEMDERETIRREMQCRLERLTSGYLVQGLQLVLTNDCNLGCTYCFSDTILAALAVPGSEVPGMPNAHRGSHDATSGSCSGNKPARQDKMSPQTAIAAVRNTIEVLRRNGNKTLTVEFFGGEPLLNCAAIEAVLKTFGAGSHDDVSIFYTITTNGAAVTDEVARMLHDHNVTVMVSYDSPKNVSRLTKRGTSADYLITRGLEVLKRNSANVTFNTVISVDNVDDFNVDGLLGAAQTYNARTVALILDLAVKPYQNSLGIEKVFNAVVECCEKAQQLGIQITGYWHQIFEQMTGARPINLEKGYKTCAAEGCKISVEPDGSIANCKCGTNPIGHVDRLDDIFHTTAYRAYALKAYETTPLCEGCDLEGFCSGLCMGTLENTYGDVSVRVDPVCDLYRRLTSSLIRITPADGLDKVYLKDYQA